MHRDRERQWTIVAAGMFAVLTTAAPAPAEAQLFGARQLGGTLSRRAQPGMADAGVLTGAERFLRGNRSARDFVGRDTRDTASFVGVVPGGTTPGLVRSAVTNLRDQTDRQVNRPEPTTSAARSQGPYQPRLELGFAIPPLDGAVKSAQLTARMARFASAPWLSGVAVEVQARTAILRGVVASEEQRLLAEELVRLEPGIDQVQNELTVGQSGPKAESKPVAPAEPGA